MDSRFIEQAIMAIEKRQARRIDGSISINKKEFEYRAYLISSVKPIIRIDIFKKEGES